MNFEDATPIKAPLGRKPQPNPFADVIAEIALKTDDTGQPKAKRFVQSHEVGESDKAINRIKRLTSEAGAVNDPPVTVRVVGEPVTSEVKGKKVVVDNQTLITFWTIKRQERPHKSAENAAQTETQTASTDQSVAVSQS